MTDKKNETETNLLRLPAEKLYAREIDALKEEDIDPIPTGWQMSPKKVRS